MLMHVELPGILWIAIDDESAFAIWLTKRNFTHADIFIPTASLFMNARLNLLGHEPYSKPSWKYAISFAEILLKKNEFR